MDIKHATQAPTGFAAEERSMLKGRGMDASGISSFLNWYPVTISADSNTVWWRYMGEKRFIEAFFQDSLTAQEHADRQVCVTSLDALDVITPGMNSVAPTAFIFHVSRCGSTLLTQMLASLEQCIVMSEPPVIDAFFRLYHAQTDLPDAVQKFRHLISMLAQQRDVNERHFFIKFDSWHLPWLPFIRQAFPGLPFIFLYREPQAVLASHRRQCGPQMIPGLLNVTRLQVDRGAVALTDMEGYAQAVLESLFRSGLAQVEAMQLILLDYQQLPDVLWQDLLKLFGVDATDSQIEKIRARAFLHSKNRHVAYQGEQTHDVVQKGAVKKAGLTCLEEIYAELEKRRLKRKMLLSLQR